MKKYFLFAFALLMAAGAQAATEIYAVKNSTKLVIYYDSNRNSNNGRLAPNGANDGWLTFSNISSITTVEFDASLRNAKPTSTAYWFDGLESLTTVTNPNYLNTSNVTTMERMFRSCKKLEAWPFAGSVNFTMYEVTNLHSMFYNCQSLKQLDWSSYPVPKVTDTHFMFANCYALTSLKFRDDFDTRNVTNMSYMFEGCKSLTSLNISMFEVGKVKNMKAMFDDCEKLKTIKADYDWKSVAPSDVNSDSMFYNCPALVGGNGTKYNKSNITIAYAHPDGMNNTNGYFTKSACPKPRNLRLDYVDATTIRVSWDAESKHILNEVRYMKYSDPGYSSIEVTGNSATKTGLEPNAKYNIEVVSTCSSTSKSPNSEVLEVSTAGAGVEELYFNDDNCTKIIRNGQLYIRHGDKLYDARGVEVK